MPPGRTRRIFLSGALAGAGSLAAALAAPALAQTPSEGTSGPRPLRDMLDYMVRTLGPPRQAQRVGADEAALYQDRVPPRLIRFWQEHGRGSYFDGLYWICDPAPLRAVIDLVFKDDPELDSADMTAVAYTAFGHVTVWDRRRANINVHFQLSSVFVPPERAHIDSATGERFPDDYMIGTAVGIVRSQYLPSEHAFLEAARARLGPLTAGEVYGFFPALQLGGAYTVENLRRVKAAEHFTQLVQLAPMNLVALTPPAPPAFPYGRQTVIRRIGREN
jgi:hypothetical protein